MTQRTTLLTTFATRTFFLTAALAIGLGLLITYEMLYNVRTTSMHAVSGLIGHSLERVLHDVDLDAPLQGEALEKADEEATAGVIDHDIVSIKVINHDKVVVYSTVRDEIGTVVPNGEFAAALAGGTEASIVTSGDDASAAEVQEHGTLLAVYAPIRQETTGPVIGAVEAYQRFAPIQAAMARSLARIWGAVLIAVLIGYFVQYRLVRAASIKHEETKTQVGELHDRLARSLTELEDHYMGTLRALTWTVDAKDRYTARHSVAVTDYALMIGARLSLSTEDMRVLERSGLLHDLGKIGVPERILLKPGTLTQEEMAIMRDHSETGARILGSIPFLTEVVPTVRHHHERWDGGGYPANLAGAHIPLTARILAVADAFDAMVTDRPYRPAVGFADAGKELVRCSGTQFDPTAVDALLTHPLVIAMTQGGQGASA